MSLASLLLDDLKYFFFHYFSQICEDALQVEYSESKFISPIGILKLTLLVPTGLIKSTVCRSHW